MKRLQLTAGVAILVACAWIVFELYGHSGPAKDSDLTVVSEPRPESDAVRAAPSDRRDSPGRREVRTPVDVTRSDARNVTLIGRCVTEEGGGPVPGCSIKIEGRPLSPELIAEHGEPESWQDPETTTGTDGRFELAFDPPPAFRFTLALAHERYVHWGAVWPRLEPGKVLDLGEIALATGVRLVGRLVDTDKNPVPKGEVLFSHDPGFEYGELSPVDFYRLRVEPDGRFEAKARLLPGTWSIRLGPGLRLVGPRKIVVGAGEVTKNVTITARAARDVPYLSGRVLDEAGHPVTGAKLDYEPSRGGSIWRSASGGDGSFVVYKRDGDSGDPVRLRALTMPVGFEPPRDERRFAWGTAGIELVVRRSPSLEVEVVESGSHRPVTEYGVRCFLDPRAGSFSNVSARRRHRGDHERGVSRIPARLGKNILIVEPTSRALLPSKPLVFDVRGAGQRVRVEVSRRATGAIRVEYGDGEPVAGTKVELVRPLEDARVDLGARTTRLGRFFGGSFRGGIELSSGTTEQDGRLTLSGPPGEPLALRVLGPGHEPLLVQPFVLPPSDAPARIVVSSGATLRGKVVPLELVAVLRPKRVTPGQPVPRYELPGVRLESTSGSDKLPSASGSFPVGEDGTFEITGIPRGSWRVVWSYYVKLRSSSGTWNNEPLQVVELKQDEVREVTLDVSHLRFGSLTGRVFVDGAPLRNTTFELLGERKGPNGKPRMVAAPGPNQTDAGGTFAVDVPPASYRLSVEVTSRSGEDRAWIPCRDSVTVAPGKRTEHAFHFGRTRLTVTLLSDAGTAVARRRVWLVVKGSRFHRERQTNAAGIVVLDPAPLGEFELRMYPAELQDWAARRAWWKKHPGRDPSVVAGRITVPPGRESFALELRLPPGVR